MNIGVSGHQDLPAQAKSLLTLRLEHLLSNTDRHYALSSLASGTDQIFASICLGRNASLHAIVPCTDYESTFTTDDDLKAYQRLVKQAEFVTHLPFPKPSEEAFLAAGLIVVERSDLLLAVWDGEPSRGLGGTADIVNYANEIGRPVETIWPPGLSRK